MPKISYKPAVHSDSIVDSYGVNVHTGFWTTSYANTDLVVNRLSELGARYVRDRLPKSDARQKAAFLLLYNAGIKVHATAAILNSSLADTDADIEQRMEVVASNPEWFVSVAGPNEPQNFGSGWAAVAKSQTATIKSLSPVPVVAPALKEKVADVANDYWLIGATGIKDVVDYGDYHNYPGPNGPATDQDLFIQLTSEAYAGKKTYCTEGGYNTGIGVTTGGFPVDEYTQAIYAPRHLLETYSRGVRRFFQYELMDMNEDPANNDWSAHWGLLHTNGEPKPAFYSMKEFLGKLSDPGPVFSPASRRIDVSGPTDLKWILTGKRDGTHAVVAWRNVKPGTAPAPVTVKGPVRNWKANVSDSAVIIPI